jgi:acetyl esterase/lipase
MRLALGLLVATTLSSGSLPAQTLRAPRIYTYREVAGQALRAYVFRRDSTRPAAGILLFHGGGWSTGEPAWTFDAARRFADWGLVAIAVQYRLASNKVTPIDALADVCAAFSWARTDPEALGLSGRLAGYGVSAGGHLVAATTTVGCPDGTAGPDALILWSPALDLARDTWFRRLLQGKAPPAAYSPVEHIGAATPPTSIVHGAEDALTPLAGVVRFCERLRALPRLCELNVFPGLGHLLTRNLQQQEQDFDPDPAARATGILRQGRFLQQLGFLAPGPL